MRRPPCWRQWDNMAGLFDTLALGSRSMQTYRKAIDTSGHNLANVNTPGYTRQRLVVETVTTEGEMGSTGAGAEGTRIIAIKNEFTQKQLQVETSLEGSLEVKDDTLRQTLNALQETIDRSGSGASTNGLSQKFGEFFASLQSLSNNPSSIADRQVVLQKAQDLAAKFNQIDSRLGTIGSELEARLETEVTGANQLLEDIAGLNRAIAGEESAGDSASDLRDARQSKIESLAKLVKFDAVEQPNGAVNIVVGGQSMVEGIEVTSSLETFTSDEGQLMVGAEGQASPLNLGGGSMTGIISVRDGQLARVRTEIDQLASVLIGEANAVHAAGFGLGGETGAAFFEGTGAGTIAVNSDLLKNPSRLQASGKEGVAGDNTTVRGLAGLASKAQGALSGQTFVGRQTQIVSALAQDASSATADLEDQLKMTAFVRGQRDSVSGVSLDEEMANLVMFQKAFQASAKLISMTDEMLATIIGM